MTPLEALEKYKITTRPTDCSACPRRAYYMYPIRGYLCSLCLLDLVNVAGLEWDWDDYPEIWKRYNNSDTISHYGHILDNTDGLLPDNVGGVEEA
jgi:hypothetical protein